MRVTGGVLKGRFLKAPLGSTTRPSTDKVRKATFDLLFGLIDLHGARILDLFAGTGAMGIEAVSRGAESVVFVDSNLSALRPIKENLKLLSTIGNVGHVEVVKADILDKSGWGWLTSSNVVDDKSRNLFDLVFCDPPYAFDAWEILLCRLEDSLSASMAVLESRSTFSISSSWRLSKQKRYGDTLLSIVVPA